MNTALATTSHRLKDRREFWPNYGLFFLGVSVTLYLNLTTVAGFDVRPVQLGPILVAFIAFLFLPSINKNVPRIYFVLPCLWACYMLVRHTVFDDAGQLVCVRTLVNVVAYLTALKCMLRIGRINWLLAGLLLGMVISVALAMFNFDLPQMVTTSVRMGNGRWQGLMPGANRFANLCAITFVTGVGLLTIKSRLILRLVLTLVVSIALLGLAMSGSRGAAFTAGVSTVALLWFAGRAQGWLFFSPRIIVFSAVALIVGIAMFTYNKEIIPERLVALIDSPDDALAKIEDDSRRDLFEIAYDIFLEHPVFGAGASAGKFTILTRRGELEISSHNMYLKFLSTSGLVGLIGYLALPLFMMFRLCSSMLWSSPGRTQAIAFTPLALTWLILILTHGFVISIGQTAHIWLFFAAAAYVSIEQTKNQRVFQLSRKNSKPNVKTNYHTRRLKPTLPRLVG
jgi:O-antigen ligase